MSNSFRIRTEVGVDKAIQVKLEQEYDFLEILSLKILPNQIYTRSCANYGVIVGRVSVNNGFGVPNAKVSVFIPLMTEDENNPYITSIYPYKTPNDINDDGYQYNLLPYTASYNGHVPTGTFPTREDVLVDPNVAEIYDKYYKFTVQTNDSGDFMIFGVPTGTHTLVMNVDLSDIGQFSLSPQDLIRMGRGNPAQFDGPYFKSSPNFAGLPQIVVMQKTIEVQPLWGQPELCILGVNRSDFDLGTQGIKIEPTSIFMGSVYSDNDDNALARNCKPSQSSGNICNFIAGPGEILAIRQTIYRDNLGRPLLEQYSLDNGGKVIDSDGAWLLDLPMNLDYVYTNEFGENIISLNPKIGIPTKGKYRFKIKWEQPNSLSTPIRRASFLVPNIKEWGWGAGDPNNDPLTGEQVDKIPCSYNLVDPKTLSVDFRLANSSYAFSTDWDAYGVTGTTLGNAMIREAINCEDRFYEFQFNKVYTISQLMTEYRKGFAKRRIIGIKYSDNKDCEALVNKFPSNDAQYRFDFLYILFQFILIVLVNALLELVVIVHLVYVILYYYLGLLYLVKTFVCDLSNVEILGTKILSKILKKPCEGLTEMYNKFKNFLKTTRPKLPNILYPSCQICECNNDNPDEENSNISTASLGNATNSLISDNPGNSPMSDFTAPVNYTCSSTYNTEVAQELAGYPVDNPAERYVRTAAYTLLDNGNTMFSSNLTLPERLNLFNTKGKYFDSTVAPGGGVNKVKVTFNSDDPFNSGKFHYDNVIVMVIDTANAGSFDKGSLFTFQDPTLSKDINLTGLTTLNEYGTYSITGTSVGTAVPGTNVVETYSYLNFANPDGTGNTTPTTTPGSPFYHLTGYSDDAQYAKFSMDLEYFQVIQSVDMATFLSLCSTSTDSLPERFLLNTNDVFIIDGTSPYNPTLTNYKPSSCFTNFDNQQVVICVRGVDPNSTSTKIKYDLSLIYGYSSFGNTSTIVEDTFKLNIPIQGDLKCVDHAQVTNSNQTDSHAGGNIFFDSYHFQPGTEFSSFTTNMISYYSNVDYNSPLVGLASNSVVVNGAYGDLRISSNNYYSWDFSKTGDDLIGDYNTVTLNSKGYYSNEPVEGGSFVAMNISQRAGGSPAPNNSFDINGVTTDYYGTKYGSTITTNMVLGSSGRQIVMRTDRLPTSTSVQDIVINNSNGSYLRTDSFALFTNNNLNVFLIGPDGQVQTQLGVTQQLTPDQQDDESVFSTNGVLSSFSVCSQAVPLGCYGTDSNGNLVLRGGNCNQFLGQTIMQNGCYTLVTTPILSLITDLYYIYEWQTRFILNLGICRGIIQNMFTNNWINGSLYMFPFKNDRFFNSKNKPYSCFCKHVIYQEVTTKSFYYRSTPWDGNYYVGRNNPSTLLGSYNGNEKDLMFPTTIMDLGPRTDYQQELVFSDSYDGYVMNKLASTTYQDPSNLVNLLVISRIGNANFLSVISTIPFGGAQVASQLFSRNNSKIDADYAQMLSINSELGVKPFTLENYTDVKDIFITNGNVRKSEAMFGVFYKSDTQTRDWITPKRTIINENNTATAKCSFSNFPTKSQYVPLYEWSLQSNTGEPNIFGNQENDWHTNNIDAAGNGFFAFNYQSLDRLKQNSRYFRSVNVSKTKYQKGYIYAVDGSGNITYDVTQEDLNASPLEKTITVGNPFFFYFGLSNGKTAYDKFLTKWTKTEILVD